MLNPKVIINFFITGALVFTLVSCSDDKSNGNNSDGGKSDGTNTPAGCTTLPTKLECDDTCQGFVMSRILFPTSNENPVGIDFDGDGEIENQLGTLLSTVSGTSPDMNMQEAVDRGIYGGSTVILLKIKAQDMANSASVEAQAWLGENQTCCSDPEKLDACKTESLAGCFNGSHTFCPAADSPTDTFFCGKITNSALALGPSKMLVSLPFSTTSGSTNVLTLNLNQVYVQGKVAADGKSISDGLLAGVISQEDLEKDLYKTIAKMLDDTIKDPDQDENVKKMVTGLFDTDKDGTITEEDLKNNPTVQAVIKPDVDTDGDGKADSVSLAVNFEAVGADIQATCTTTKSDAQFVPTDAQVTPSDAGMSDSSLPN